MIPVFTSLIEQNTLARLRVSVFYTRASIGSSDVMYLSPGVTLAPGRFDAAKFLDDVVTSTQRGVDATGVFVGVCGPPALARDVEGIVRTFDARRKRMVGGVEHLSSFQSIWVVMAWMRVPITLVQPQCFELTAAKDLVPFCSHRQLAGQLHRCVFLIPSW